MSILNLLNQISTEDFNEEQTDRFMDRKQAMGKMSNFGKKLAISALPLGAVAALTTPPAKAQSGGDVLGALNFALTLEYLESTYYQTGLDSGVIESDAQTVYQQINKHEQDHVSYLQDTINAVGGTPVDKPTFDFTGGSGSGNGPFDPFNDYTTFIILSQAFEDTGVRAYKGQAPNLQGNAQALTQALRVHSVEARHASEVRRLREDISLKGWITGGPDGEGVPSAARPVYSGEANTNQLGVDVSQFVSEDAATEAFDEPLTMDQVLTVANLFIDNGG